MANEIFLHRVAGACVGVIARNRFCRRVAGGWQQCVLGERVDAVALQDGSIGQTITFHMFGLLSVTAGAAILDGDLIMSDANGQAITYAAGGGGRYQAGFADSAASGAGVPVTIQHRPMAIAG